MPETPPKYTSHRRARSEVVTLLDDISFDSDLGIVDGFDNEETTATQPLEEHVFSYDDRTRLGKHLYSLSMDGFNAFNSGGMSATDHAKKSISADKLAELSIIDPKRAKRIWANRQSAALSKERKMRYITELQRKIQTLQTEATYLSDQLTLLQKDVQGLTAKNNELKLRLQTMEQQGYMQHCTMTQLFNVRQEECSILTSWTYIVAAFALTGWSTVFMWILNWKFIFGL